MIETKELEARCRYCGATFTSQSIDGQLQCCDGAGQATCDGCYHDVCGYGHEAEDRAVCEQEHDQ